VPVRTCSYPGRNDRAPLRTVRRNRTVAELAIVSPVRCDWCGLANEAGNHASLEECVDALQREVEALRQELARVTALSKPDTPSPPDDRLPWKFRDS
jgi:hypothetical protein